MYFTATLSIDPAEITKIEKIKPTKAFGKLFYYLSAGLAASKREVETFTAVSVLQQLNMAMRSLGIDNIIRLAQDGRDIYLDTEGRKDDLREAIEAFVEQAKASSDDAQPFAILQLVLEHEDETFKYLMDLRVRREHRMDDYPISVRASGVLKQPNSSTGATVDQIKQSLAPVFEDQDSYDQFVAGHRATFDAFIEKLEKALSAAIECDAIHRDAHTKIIRPKGKKKGRDEIEYDHSDPDIEPLHAGYPGFGDVFFYTWLWSELSHEHGVDISDVTVVDETGHSMFEVGADPVQAGEGGAFDPDASFEAPEGGEVSYAEGHAFDAEFSDAALLGAGSSDVGDSGGGSDGGGWLDSVFSGGDSSSDSGASSCGSSCGGCGGGD